MLTDADAGVRLRVAQGFLAARDARAIDVLIGLIETGSLDEAWQAEELLRWRGEASGD